MNEGTIASAEMPPTIGAEIHELELLSEKLVAVLTPVMGPRLGRIEGPGVLNPPVSNDPSYLQRLRRIRINLQETMSCLEL